MKLAIACLSMVLTTMIASGSYGVAGFSEEGRTVTYLGASPPDYMYDDWDQFEEYECRIIFNQLTGEECPLPHPVTPLYQGHCDDSDWHEQGNPAIGVVLFCSIEKGNIVDVEIHDAILESPAGFGFCLHELKLGFWQPLGLALIEPRETFEIPNECAQHPDDPEGSTRVGVAIRALDSSVGEVTLTPQHSG